MRLKATNSARLFLLLGKSWKNRTHAVWLRDLPIPGVLNTLDSPKISSRNVFFQALIWPQAADVHAVTEIRNSGLKISWGDVSKASKARKIISRTINSYPYQFNKPESNKVILDILSAMDERASSTKAKSINNSFDSLLTPWRGKVGAFEASQVLKRIPDPFFAVPFILWLMKQMPRNAVSKFLASLIVFLGKEKNGVSIKLVHETLKANHVSLNRFDYGNLILAYRSSNMPREAEEAFLEMREKGLSPDIYIFNTMLEIFLRSGNEKKGKLIQEEMKAFGVNPDLRTYNTLMSFCVRTKSIREAKRVRSMMVESGLKPDIFTWNATINLYGKTGNAMEALQAFEEMRSSGIKPDLFTYSSIIDVCGKADMFVTVNAVLKSMVDSGINPDAVLLCSMIYNLGKHNRVQEAEQLFTRFKNNGVVCNIGCYNALLYVSLRGGGYSRVTKVMEELSEMGLSPDIKTHVMLLSFFTRSEGKEAMKLLSELNEKFGASMRQLFAVLDMVSGEISEELVWMEVNRLLNRFSSEGVDRRKELECSLITLLEKRGYIGPATRLWEKARIHWTTMMLRLSGEDWKLDLHEMSEGTVRIALQSELMRLRKIVLGEFGTPFLGKATIITGRGQQSPMRRMSCVKLKVEEILEGMDSPFVQDADNSGIFVANGKDLRDWLERLGMKKVSGLENSCL